MFGVGFGGKQVDRYTLLTASVLIGNFVNLFYVEWLMAMGINSD